MSKGLTIGRRPSSIPHELLRPAILVCGALLLMLLILDKEQVQGQRADIPASVMVLLALLVGTAVQDTAWCRHLLEVVTRPRSLALIAVVAFVVLAAGSLFVFGTKPLSGDERLSHGN